MKVRMGVKRKEAVKRAGRQKKGNFREGTK